MLEALVAAKVNYFLEELRAKRTKLYVYLRLLVL